MLDGPTGTELTNVQLTSPSGSNAVSPPQHSGGVAVDGDNVYVVSSEGGSSYLYQYSLSEIRGADAGGSVPALSVSEVPASSYVSTANGNLYLGAWNDDGPGQLYSYPLGSVPSLIRPGTSARRRPSARRPARTAWSRCPTAATSTPRTTPATRSRS